MQEKNYDNHILLDTKDCGDCRTLLGNVVVTFVLADDSSGAWTEEDITQFKKESLEAGQKLLADAKEYGGKLQLFLNYVRCKVQGCVSIDKYKAWVKSALEAAGLPSDGTANKYLEKRYSADEAPVLFCVNYKGRAFASPAYAKSGFEYAVLYKGDSDFRHELYHIFGAKDFYYPESVQTESKLHFAESVMNNGAEKADPFTAYLVGWCPTPSPAASAFLNATASVTEKEVNAARKEKTYTGCKTIPYGDGTYTGQLETGSPNGRGTHVYGGGNVYDGEWDHGTFEGHGTFKWVDGSVYTGGWHKNMYHGEGVMRYTDGSMYAGTFCEGVFCGSGIMKYKNGAIYDGNWMDGQRHGYGVLIYGDGGTVYMGNWNMGEIDGGGILKYKNGSVYDGEWYAGKYHGRGKLSYSDGTVLEGRWELGEYKGRA